MDTIFINSRSGKTSDPHRLYRLLLNLSEKISLKELINMLLYQILGSTIYRQI